MRNIVSLALVGFSFLTALAAQSEQPTINTGTKLDARTLRTGRFIYRTLEQGSDVGQAEIIIQKIESTGNYVFSAEITGKFRQRWESVATSSFEPISANLSFGEGNAMMPSFDLRYGSGRVTGTAFLRKTPGTSRSVDALVPADTIDQRIDWAAVLSNNLEAGREFEFKVYDPGTGISRVLARVGPIERVQVPAGSFDAYRIIYRIEKTKGVETYQVLATNDPYRLLIREEFPDGAVAELMEIAESNAAVGVNTANVPIHDDQKIVAGLDTQYQAAVKKNDAATMDRILADDFVLVTGSGKTYTKSDLLTEARSEHVVYEHQEDSAQTVRLWGDTAVVTAKLWEKGTDNGKPFDYTVWFSDTYVRTPTGWRYVFGQSSLQCPKPRD